MFIKSLGPPRGVTMLRIYTVCDYMEGDYMEGDYMGV